MDLVKGGGSSQFVRVIPKYFVIGGTVVEPPALPIDHCDHVGSVFCDELEELVAVRHLPTHSVELEMLIHRIYVKHQN